MMHRIKGVRLGGVAETGYKFKIIESTAGEFLSRTCAYNQVIERIENKLKKRDKGALGGPPLKILSFRYERMFKSRQRSAYIKFLTKCRLTGKTIEGTNIFNEEIEYVRKRIECEDKVCIFFSQISPEDWNVFDYEDTKSISSILIKAGSPHPTIAISPKFLPEEGISLIKDIKKDLSEDQSYIVTIHPHMNRVSQGIIVDYCVEDTKCLGVMAVGKTPSQSRNSLSYVSIARKIPNNKLFFIVDVEDKFGLKLSPAKSQLLPTQIALKYFGGGADITCRQVKTYLSGKAFEKQETKDSRKMAIYLDQVGGLLNEEKQRDWTGKSIIEIINKRFEIIDGFSMYELITAFNFWALNKTAIEEVSSIKQKKHMIYIKNRAYLSGFLSNFGKEI